MVVGFPETSGDDNRMSIIAHGIDLVECERIEEMLQRHDRRFLDRVFTAAEQKYALGAKRQTEHLAGRFAVKEAVLKVIGTGWSSGAAWTDIETVRNPSGKPQVNLFGRVAEIASSMGIRRLHVSITHARNLAIASVVATDEDEHVTP